MKLRILALALILGSQVAAQRAKHGNRSITATNTFVNEYTALSSDANAGDALITVNASGLNTNNRFPNALQAGDLLLIIQMQGATLESGSNNPNFGRVTSYNNCGNYEWVEVAAVPSATTISLLCPLQHAYTASGHVQVIRVPRYNNLTVATAASISAPDWDGNTGGVLVVETSGFISMTGAGNFDVSGRGFRGGSDPTPTASGYGIMEYALTGPNDYAAEKGEGIGGAITDYDAIGGRLGRGAAANGGGGGNAHNHGGGGGSNAGDISLYNGLGNPDNSNSNWTTAWNLEAPNFANNTSSGGGRGGYSFSGNNLNALTTGPNQSGWGGDYRRSNAGQGGWPLDYSTGKIFLGGGGGAGEENGDDGGDGGRGGGIILLRAYGDITGSGGMRANGANGGTASGSLLNGGKDAAGGGGGGGAILVSCSGTLSAISLEAKGGTGGNQDVPALTNEAEGPGGGGGGGYIAITTGPATTNVSGGANGTTDSAGLTEFTPNGATRGGAGQTGSLQPLIRLEALNDSVCGPGIAVLEALPSNAGTYIWANTIGGTSLGTADTLALPITANQTVYLSACPLAQTITAQATVLSLPSVDAGVDSSICVGASITLNGTGTGTLQWNANSWLSNPSIANPVANPLSDTTFVLQATSSEGCIQSDSVWVQVKAFTTLSINPLNAVCMGDTIFIDAQSDGTISWNSTANLSAASGNSIWAFTTVSTDVFAEASALNQCTQRDTVSLVVNALPLVDAGADLSICFGSNGTLDGSGTGTLQWEPSPLLTDVNDMQAVISPINDGFLVLQATSAEGCIQSDTVQYTLGNVLNIVANVDTALCPGTGMHLSLSGAQTYVWESNPVLVDLSSPVQDILPTESTELVVLASADGGCSTRDTIRITVHPLSNLSIDGGGLFCENDSVSLSLQGAVAVTWEPTNGLSAPSANTTMAAPAVETSYVAHYTDMFGCNYTSNSVTVSPSVAPSAAFTSLQISNYEVVFEASPVSGAQYAWTMDGTELSGDSIVHNFPFDDTYSVMLVVSTPCGSDTLIRDLDVIKMVGIAPVVLEAIEVYPNPAVDRVQIQHPFSTQGARIRIFDAAGRQVAVCDATGTSTSIPLRHLAEGLYVIRWESESRFGTAKFQH
jgi:hypothetical protein